MDPDRLRTMSRLGGLVLLVLFAAALLGLRRGLVLLQRKDRRGEPPAATSPQSAVTTSDAPTAARALLGRNARIAAEDDVDGDGHRELLVVADTGAASLTSSTISRLAVVTETAPRHFEVRLDTDRMALLTPSRLWRAHELGLRRTELDPVTADGLRLLIFWHDPSGTFNLQELPPIQR